MPFYGLLGIRLMSYLLVISGHPEVCLESSAATARHGIPSGCPDDEFSSLRGATAAAGKLILMTHALEASLMLSAV